MHPAFQIALLEAFQGPLRTPLSHGGAFLAPAKACSTAAEAYCYQIRKHCPSVIRGYPFMVYKLVRLMQASGEKSFPLKAIIFESENIYEAHCTAIKSFFGCHICHYYGHSEKSLLGENCTDIEQYCMPS
jgi:phenylacetate-coenzyme A ligase PaaK-like adenylate-forming protein